MKKIFTLIFALFCVSGTWAEDVTEEQALGQALDFLKNQENTSGGQRRVQGVTPQLTLAGKVSGLYVFNVENDGGFVVVSNDDRTIPVLGFGESGNFIPDNMPDNMRAWMQGYADEIEWLKQHDKTPTTGSPHKARKQVGSHSTAAVAPLVTSTWDQDAPYNNLCPTYNDSWYGSGRCATGCVATAMAQVMYYHKWPQAATKAIPGYTTSSYNMHLQSLPPVTFDWANMKDSYLGNYTPTQATAVATLMKYCGYSVKMDYGPSSGAYTDDVATALVDYYDYNPNTTRFVSRSSYTYAHWTDLIYHEVSHSRPVCYGGMSSGGGHEFVCDGYKFEMGTDFFHINWGWGGMSDNYFVLSALDPDQQGIGGSTSTDGFHYGQDAVIGIQKSTDSGSSADIPANVVDLTLNLIALSRNPVEPHTLVNVTFNITNNSTDPYDGDLWLAIRETDDDYLVEGQSVLLPAGATQDVVISYLPPEVGTYTFMLGYVNANGEYVVYEGMSATLTVAEALTNEVVPVYGYWTDKFSRSQFIIGEADLEEMLGGEINAISFSASQESVDWGAAKFDVYVKEVEESTISALKAWNTLDKVYSGSLSIVNNEMKITFDEPYPYQGGNLLVGINQTVSGSYNKSSWYGERVTGASVGGYDTNITQQNFLPDVTFDFTPGSGTHVRKPKNLAVHYTGGDEATVKWSSDAPSFDIDVNGTVTEDVTNPCTLTGLEYATKYYIKVRAKNEDVVSDWTEPVFFTTVLSDDMCQIRLELTDAFGDGWNGAAIKVIDVLSGVELGTFTNTETAAKNEAQIYLVDVPNERDIEFQWVKSSYDHECSYIVYDVAGNEIFSGKGTLKNPVTYHVDCSAVVTTIALANKEDNTELIASFDGVTGCEVTLQGRTFYKDGSWNTLCLPFDLVIEDSPLEGADVRALSSAVLEGETVTLNFTDEGAVTSLVAGTPYIVKWTSGINLENPVFTGVTIDKTSRDVVCDLGNGQLVTFKGTYGYMVFTNVDKSILFVGANNKLHYPLSGASIGAQRSYFQLDGIEASLNPSQNGVKAFVMNFGDEATGIFEYSENSEPSDSWYDISGRKIVNGKLSNRKLPKGIYVNKGHKVIIK